MYLHEFQAKGLLRNYDVPVPGHGVASTASDALRVAKELKGEAWVLKAQVHAGGDDSAAAKMKTLEECGVHVAQSPADIGKKVAEVLKK